MNKLIGFINKNSDAIIESILEKLEKSNKLLPYHKDDEPEEKFEFTDKDRDEAWLKFLGKQEPIEKDFMKLLIKLFEDQRKEMIRNIKEVMTVRSISVKQNEDIDTLVNEIMFNVLAAVVASEAVLVPMETGAVISAGIAAIDTLPTTVTFDPTSEIIVNFINKKEILVKEIVNTTDKVLRKVVEDQLKENLIEGLSTGESARKIEQRVNAVFGQMEKGRAKTIARTEISSSLNFGAHEGAIQSNVVKEKQWVTARDELVRTEPFSHTAAEGETVGLREDYMKTGEPMGYPTDPSGSLANFINCRCAEIFIPVEP